MSFSNNTAKYGNDIASFAHKLKLSSNYTPPIELVPGVNYSDYFLINALDHYDQLVSTENASILLATKADNSNITVTGSIRFKVSEGIFNVSQIVIKGKPDSFANITFSTAFKFAGYQYTEEIIEIYLRGCAPGETLKGDDSCIVCPYNTYNLEAEAICIPCPDGAICYGGSNIVSAKGFWRINKQSEIFYECFYYYACLEEQLKDFDLLYKCKTGYTGNLCQGCQKGYSRDGENKCSKCGDDQSNIIFISLVTAAGAAFIFILTASNITAAYKEQSITSVYFKILTNYAQIVALTISFELDWPDLVKKLFEGQKQVVGATDRLFSIDCLLKTNIKSHYSKLILVNLTPACFSIISTIYWLLKSLIFKTSDTKSKIIGSITIQIFFFMASIIKFNFSMFNCMKINESGNFLIENMLIKCWEGDHNYYLKTVVIPGIIFWCFSIPVLLILILQKNQAKLKQTDQLLKYGFLHKGFKNKFYYWEFMILFRKIAIISCAVFLRNISIHIQALTTFVVILLAFTFHIKAKPYNVDQLNSMETKSIIVSGVTIYCGLYFMTNILNSDAKIVLFCIIVLVNAVFVFYWAFYTFGYYLTSLLMKINCFKQYVRIKNPLWVGKMIASLDTDIKNIDGKDEVSTDQVMKNDITSKEEIKSSKVRPIGKDNELVRKGIKKNRGSKIKLSWVNNNI